MDDLRGYTALVTGASRGIGAAIAGRLAESGMNLLLTARNRAKLDETANAIRRCAKSDASPIGKIETRTADLLDPASAEKIVAHVSDLFGGLDLLVNNAGIAVSKNTEETEIEDWERLMAINARAPFFLCRNALPLLERSDRGTIVNISSVVGRIGYAGQAAYTASKHAVTGFTKALAREVADSGIRVHLIAPGGVATDMVASMRPDIRDNELIAPDEIAALVHFLFANRGNGVIDEINVRRATSTPWK